MSTICKRLSRALAPQFLVEQEIGSGGMGLVFSARDTTLDRQVAIKIIRPEQATAKTARKFLREAQILANLRHPNVVPVHQAGEADGLFYYVMDYISDCTISDALTRGPLPKEQVLKLGRDLLDALDTVHDQGVVHRDIKPNNVFLVGSRAVIADFGIAKPTPDPADSVATDIGLMGTVGYMPPEQAYGLEVTNRTDLYAVAMVLFEAYTGRRWSDTPPDTKPNWTGVPTSVVPVLKRALAWEPEKRWPDSASFRRALWATRTRHYKRYKWYAIAAAATTLVLGVFMGVFLLRPARSSSELALLPFDAGPGVYDTIATNLRELTRYNLDFHFQELGGVPRHQDIDDWWFETGGTVHSVDANVLRSFGVRKLAFVELEWEGDSVIAAVRLIDRSGRAVFAGSVAIDGRGRTQAAADRISFQIAREIDPGREYHGSPALAGHSDAAVNAFLAGLRAYRRNAFLTAERHFRTAIEDDSAFGLAAWGLHNAFRWRFLGYPEPEVDLRSLLNRFGPSLPTSVRQLIDAQLAETASTRFEIYREVVERYPRDGLAAAVYAEELLNRGALSGIPLEYTVRTLENAVAIDPHFGPALGNLVWAYVRMGNREGAERSFQRFASASAGPDEVRINQVPLLALAIAERFYAPDNVAAARLEMMQQPGDSAEVVEALRLAAMLGIPQTQLDLAEYVLSTGRPSPETRAKMLEARGLALVGLGRIDEAFSSFDAAAQLLDQPESRLEAAEWRVVSHLLGMPGVSDALLEDAARTLNRLEENPTQPHRVAWALGLMGIVRANSNAVDRSTATLQAGWPDTVAVRLGVLLDALKHGMEGQYQRALDISAPLLAFDSAAQAGDPFARAVLHSKRADWFESLGDHEAADSMRLWYEHFEAIKPPESEAMAAEVDWALGSFAMWSRGSNSAASGGPDGACRHLRRVAELWAESDPPYAELRDSATTLANEFGCSR